MNTTEAFSPSVGRFEETTTHCNMCDSVDNVTTIALAILVIGVAAVVFAPILHPVLLVPGAVIAVAGGGVFLFSFETPRTFVTSLPTYFSDYRPSYSSRGYSSYASTSSYAAPAYARPARAAYPSSSAYVSNGGYGGVGVFQRR